MRVTIKDIARETGFSVTTISLVLNHKAYKIPKETKTIIREKAREMGYRPNQLAVGLIKKQTKTMGLVIADIRNVFFSNLARGIEEECQRKGWNLILCNTNNNHERELEYIQVLSSRGVDGILLVLAADHDSNSAKENLKAMRKLNLPYILLDRHIKGVNSPCISMDHRMGGYQATKHLIELGHKKIACVTGPVGLCDSMERLEGYKDALKEAGIKYDRELICHGDYLWEDGVRAVDALMKKREKKKFTAIFAFNDLSAYGVCKQLKHYHIAIPEDVSVIGYDDIFFSEIMEIPLSTIHQPIYEIGIYAVQELLLMITEKKKIDEFEEFYPSLVVRESTGPV